MLFARSLVCRSCAAIQCGKLAVKVASLASVRRRARLALVVDLNGGNPL